MITAKYCRDIIENIKNEGKDEKKRNVRVRR